MIGNLCAISGAQLEALINDPSSIRSLLYPDNGGSWPKNHLYLDKAWHGIHFTLNGQAWGGEEPLFNAILGGTEIGEDIGYGPANYLTPEQVRSLASALKAIPPELFWSRINRSALAAAKIYPNIWERDSDAIDYIHSYYDDLYLFYYEAAQRGDAVLIYIN